MAIFPEDRVAPAVLCVVQVRLDGMRLEPPGSGAPAGSAMPLWDDCNSMNSGRHGCQYARGHRWLNVLKTLVGYRLIDPGSEWRLHRQWFERSAMGDLLGEDFALAHKDNLYRCLDKLLAHKEALFAHLRQRWQDLFGARFDVLLYDLTSTYFESDPPQDEADKRRYGYSRDKRPDCVQVVIALIVTPEGFPAGLRGAARQHRRQDHAARLPGADRSAVRQGPAHLGDGPRHPHRGGAGRDAPGRSARAISGRHAQRAIQPRWSRPSWTKPDGTKRANRCRSNCSKAGRRTLCAGQERGRVDKERAMRRRACEA